MADLVSHLALGAIWKSGWRGPHPELFLVGCALPDLFGRVPGIVFGSLMVHGVPIPEAFVLGFTVLHMPAGFVPFCLLLSLLFPEGERVGVWSTLVGGCLLHLAVDLLQRHYGAGYMLLYPFSTWSWEAGWLGSEASVWWAPGLACVGVISWKRRIRHQPPAKSCVD